MLLSVKEHNIWYTDSGTGTPVVLLHGYLESSEIWNGFAEKLQGEFRVICADLPGHGSSEVYGPVHTMEFMAEVVKELLDKLGLKKVFMAGHSLGGYVTLAFLELFPEYLSGYCLFHSHPLPDSPEALQKRKREIAVVEAGKKDLMYPDNVEKMFATANLDKFASDLQRSKKLASLIPAEGIIAVLNGMMRRPGRVSVMEEGKVPCLWLLGAMDNYIPFDTIKEKVHLPATARVVILQNSGHIGFVEEQDLSVGIMKEFVLTLHIS
jgi:pimeloyl-ACP methyl ester carboxylesterase